MLGRLCDVRCGGSGRLRRAAVLVDRAVKTTLLVLVLLLLPAPSWAQASLLGDIQIERARYGPVGSPMSPAQVGEMLNAVAWKHRAEGWGLLSKTAGANVPGPGGQRIAGDILFHLPSGHHFDVCVDWEGADTPPKYCAPSWDDKGPMDAARFVAAVSPGNGPGGGGGGGGGGGNTGGITRADLQQVEDNIVQRTQNMLRGDVSGPIMETLERMFGCRDGKTPQGENCATVQDNADAIRGVSRQVKEHDEKTSALVAFFKDGKTITALSTLVTAWFAFQQTHKNP